jgi:hypothetical protein
VRKKRNDDFTWLVMLWEGKRDQAKPKRNGSRYWHPTFSDDKPDFIQKRHRQTTLFIVYLLVLLLGIIVPLLLR